MGEPASIYTRTIYRSEALLLQEVATSNSTICAERTRSFIFHRRGGCTAVPVDATTLRYAHTAVVSSTLPPSLSSLAGRCFAAFFSSKIGRPFSFTIARIHPTFIRIRGIFKKSLETHATFAFISIVSEFCKFEISKRKDVSFQKSSAFAKGLRNDCHHIFPKLSLL